MVVLKGLNFTHLQVGEDLTVLKLLILDIFPLGGCGCLGRTDFGLLAYLAMENHHL